MTSWCRVVLFVFLMVVQSTLGFQLKAEDRKDQDVSGWVSNAIQWDAIWGSQASCGDHEPTLYHQLVSSKEHRFSAEIVRHSEGVTVMIPELHRIVSIRLTSDQQLASIRVETSCEPDLASRNAKLKSLQGSPPVQNQRLQEHLEEMKKVTSPPSADNQSPTLEALRIGVPETKPPSSKLNWPSTKVDALKSIERAAQESFNDVCDHGSIGTVLIPEFELYDPGVLTVIRAKTVTCVLPIAFEPRKSSSDPYVAYATHSCVEDPVWVEKVERQIVRHSTGSKSLSCSRSQSQ